MGQADTSPSDVDATSSSALFIRVEKSSVRRGQIRANSCQVARPNSITPSSSERPSRNLSPATDSGPCRKAQPPVGVPADPSGSVTTPSRLMNSITMTRPTMGSFRRVRTDR
ncbi:hypothetical protein FB561_3750 [Kribbella amoyensis]|uniref:Uncharacterized protein n=1 Tax=Kribbella amoyensis TaxID=996641 RepID=A0A561BUM5_9ACTN|nr:hypothetical protein [Kribbella amoyensis]TWD82614.1 hypothetical protein FB561_3750 [Kribbella amoyensis]